MNPVLEVDFSRPMPLVLEETERLRALRALKLLDTHPEERFDRITELATSYFQMPVAYVALLDDDRQWFKSRRGLCFAETARDASFCQYTIQFNEPFIIPDTHQHPSAHQHPMVVNEPHIRFYAGIPLRCPQGKHNVGTFCLVDFAPRPFTKKDIAQLQAFASLAERELGLGYIIETQNELLAAREALAETQKKLQQELDEAARYISGMIPPDLTGPEHLQTLFQPSTHLGGDGLGYRRIDEDKLAIYAIDVTGHGIGSALMAVGILEFLRSKEVRGLDFSQPAEVLERMNRIYRMEQHDGKFLCAWYSVYSRSAQTLTLASAGSPPAILMDRENNTIHLEATPAGSFVLGVLPEIQPEQMTVPFPPGRELLLFTDGLYELHHPNGQRTDFPDFLQALQNDVTEGFTSFEAAKNWLTRACAQKAVGDDVSLLSFWVE